MKSINKKKGLVIFLGFLILIVTTLAATNDCDNNLFWVSLNETGYPFVEQCNGLTTDTIGGVNYGEVDAVYNFSAFWDNVGAAEKVYIGSDLQWGNASGGTAMLWYNKTANTGATVGLLTHADAAATGFEGINLLYRNDNVFECLIGNATATTSYQSTAGAVNIGDYNYFACMFNSTHVKLWQNSSTDIFTVSNNQTIGTGGAYNMSVGGAGEHGTIWDIDGLIDEARGYDEGLSDSEIEQIRDNNTIGGAVAATYTRFDAASFDVNDVNFSAPVLTTLIAEEFVTTGITQNFTLFSTFNLRKATVSVNADVYAQVFVNGTNITDETLLRSVSSTLDYGSAGLPPVNFYIDAGTHNITVDFRNTGVGLVELSNIDFTLINTTLYNHTLIDLDFSHTDGWGVGENYTITNQYDANLLSAGTSTLTTTGVTQADYYFNDTNDSYFSPVFSRYFTSGSSVGSIGFGWLEPNVTASLHLHEIYANESSGETVTFNGTVVVIEMNDSTSGIDGFQETNSSTNDTIHVDLTAGEHLIVNASKLVRGNGNSYMLFATASVNSQSGAQTPTYKLNSSSGTCETQKLRYLLNSNDIGNLYMFFLCKGLVNSTAYDFQLWAEVEAGETIRLYDESFTGAEAYNFSITGLNLPPTPQPITAPEFEEHWASTNTIEWDAFPDDGAVLYNVSILNDDWTMNTTLINGTALTSYAGFDTSVFVDGNYSIQVDGCDALGACSLSRQNFTIDNLIPAISIIAPVNDTDYYFGTANYINATATDIYMYNFSADIYFNNGTFVTNYTNDTGTPPSFELYNEYTTTLIVGDYFINFTAMDSHTNMIDDGGIGKNDKNSLKLMKDGETWATVNNSESKLAKVNVDYLFDRQKITYNFTEPITSFTEIIHSDLCNIQIMDKITKIPGHLVFCNRWYDAEAAAKQGWSVKVQRINNNTVRIDYSTANPGLMSLDPATGGLNLNFELINFSIVANATLETSAPTTYIETEINITMNYSYTANGTLISGATCTYNVTDPDSVTTGPFTATEYATSYEGNYTTTSTGGVYNYSVICGHVDWANLTDSDEFTARVPADLSVVMNVDSGDEVTYSYCSGNNKIVQMNKTACIDNNCANTSYAYTVICEHGCFEGECAMSATNLGFIIIIIAFIILLVLIAMGLG